MAQYLEKVGGTWQSKTPKATYKKTGGNWITADFSQLDLKNYICDFREEAKIGYVSFGDSIAAGHAIDKKWYDDYTTSSQYGEGNNKQTVIVPNCYTDLIGKDLKAKYGAGNVTVKSFARSGDRIVDLMAKLDKPEVIEAVQKANYVTICIGANTVLIPVAWHLGDYINLGDAALVDLINDVQTALDNVATDTYDYSYRKLFDKLYSINDKAEYVFMTIYSPYKYLWLDEGVNGFFKPLLDTIPRLYIDIDEIIERMYGLDELTYWSIKDWQWKPIELGIELGAIIKEGLLNTSAVRQLFDRVNGIDEISNAFVDSLNNVIKGKIEAFNKDNFIYVDAKGAFDTYPDRIVPATVHYNDLLNVQFTRGFDTVQMDWGELWRHEYGDTIEDVTQYWEDLVFKYLTFQNAAPSLNVWDYVSIDIEGFAKDLVGQVVEKVIARDCDAHPKPYGHQVLHQLFSENFEAVTVPTRTVSFAAGEHGYGTMTPIDTIVFNGNSPYILVPKCTFTPDTSNGYYFNGWLGSDGKTYSDGDTVCVDSDMTLTAQWSNMYTITYMHTNHTGSDILYDEDTKGRPDCYQLWVDFGSGGQLMEKFGDFKDGTVKTFRLAYGSPIGVVVDNYNPSEIFYDDVDCYIYWNNNYLKHGWGGTSYDFKCTGNMTIDFRWRLDGSLTDFNAKSWYNCYITENK